MKTMILAAGLGQRMAPLSEIWAKPALPILDEPLVNGLLRLLAAHGATEAIVNAHAHPETLRSAVRDAPIPVQIALEPELLDSGGGIVAVRHLLEGSDPFVVVNGDMSIDLDLSAMVRAHRESGALATLAVRDDPRVEQFGTLGWDSAGDLRRITKRIDLGGEVACGVFVGVHVLSPAAFARMPAAGAFGIMDQLYVRALRDGARVRVFRQASDARWWPVGTPRELLDANLDALAEQLSGREDRALVARNAIVHGTVIGPAWVGNGAVISEGAVIGPRAVVSARSAVDIDTALTDAVALPGAHLRAGMRLSRGLAFGDKVWRDD